MTLPSISNSMTDIIFDLIVCESTYGECACLSEAYELMVSFRQHVDDTLVYENTKANG